MEEEKKVVSDDELIEDIDYSKDDAPVEIIYRCKKCGQILDKNAKDCWNCSSKEIERVIEEETKEVKKVLLQAKIDKLEHEIKSLKSANNLIYLVLVAIVAAICIYFISHR